MAVDVLNKLQHITDQDERFEIVELRKEHTVRVQSTIHPTNAGVWKGGYRDFCVRETADGSEIELLEQHDEIAELPAGWCRDDSDERDYGDACYEFTRTVVNWICHRLLLSSGPCRIIPPSLLERYPT